MKKYEHNYGKNPEGVLSTTSGYATETTNFGEAAFGILNKSTRDKSNFTTPEVVSSSTATLFSVGNGSDGIRKNIIELKADGTVLISGVGGYDGTNPDDATGIADKMQGIEGSVDRFEEVIDSISVVKDETNDLVYTLMVDGEERGSINIPKDQFLKSVMYNEDTNELIFTFVTSESDNQEVRVNMTDLVDTYTAGDGLNLEGGQFSVKVDADTQSYIEVTANGVKIIGINEALDKKVSWDDSKKVITLPADGSISALRNNGLEGGVLVCQRTYDEGVTYVTEVGTTKNSLTLNSTARPKIDFAGGSSENIAYESEIPDLTPLQTAIGSNTYTGANYISKETNLTDAVVQLDEEIKATNDNLALEHANAEATYAKKTELEGYLPLSGGTLNGGGYIEIPSESGGSVYSELNNEHIYFNGDGDNSNSTLDPSSLDFYNTSGGTTSYGYKGISLYGKTSTDILHAGGGTISINDLKTQVAPDLSSYATKSEVNAKVSGTGVSSIQVVATLPDVQEEGVLYIVTGEEA